MTLLVLLPLVALLFIVALWLVFARPHFVPATPRNQTEAAISIIIPARNEEGSLPNLLHSLEAQSCRAMEVIVVDDSSEDRTAEIARGLGAEVLVGKPLKEGWKGKPWALQQGAEAAKYEWLFFLDADTKVEPEGLNRLAELTKTGSGVAHSVCPYHRCERWFEHLSAFFNFIMAAGSSAFGRAEGRRAESALFGQSLLIHRDDLAKVGGYEKAKDKVLENFALARFLQSEGVERRCYLGKKVLSMRMFSGSFSEMGASWKKGFVSGAKGAGKEALILISIWLTGAMMVLTSLILLACGFGEAWFALMTVFAYLSYALAFRWVFRLVGNFSWWTWWLWPLALVYYQSIFGAALLQRRFGGEVEWKGRNVA